MPTNCVCGHPPHPDTPCRHHELTEHFEGTNHGGILGCGCIEYEPDDETTGDDNDLKPDYTTNGYHGRYGDARAQRSTP